MIILIHYSPLENTTIQIFCIYTLLNLLQLIIHNIKQLYNILIFLCMNYILL